MQIHQLRDVVDHLLGVLQRAHALPGHLRADHLVVMKAHAAVGLVPAGGGLADVMQQRRPPQHQIRALVLKGDRLPQHRQRMLIDVLVLMVFVDGHPHRAHFRQHHIAQPGLHHQVDARDRIRAQKKLVQLGGDAFGGDPAQLWRHLDQRAKHPRRHAEPELRDEPRRPQHPQRVVAERDLGRRRRVEHLGAQRRQTA